MHPVKGFCQVYTTGLGSGRGKTMKRDTFKTWALVINGARCRILRELSSLAENPPAELVLRSESRNLREIMSDKPGRSFASMGGGRRSAMEYTSDPVAEDQREFIRQVIALLESHRRAGDFEKLAVFAEHDMLGHLRQLMPKSLRDLVIREVPKNFLHLPAQELVEVVVRELRDGTELS
jgi:protein required for attachment to host cells